MSYLTSIRRIAGWLMILAPAIAFGQTTIAQYNFVINGNTFTAPGEQTIAVGTLFFQDDNNLIVKIANASTVEGYITGFFMLDPGADPIGYGSPITALGGPNDEWDFLDSLNTDLTGSSSPIAVSDADAYFGAYIQGNPVVNGIAEKATDPLDYHYFTFSFVDLNLTDIENTFSNPANTLPTMAVRWREVACGDSDKGYFGTTISIVPEPSQIGLLSIPFIGLLVTTRRKR